MFSIIIPLYNKEKYIEQTIKSILTQTFTLYEIIVINDGSTDSSSDIVKRIKDPRIKLYSKKNEGVSKARNYGIQKSQFDYIAFCDADDKWHPHFLETLYQSILKYKDDVFFSTARFEVNNNGITTITTLENTNKKDTIISDICPLIKKIITSSICVKKNIFQEVGGFREGVKRGEDLDLWVRINSKYRLVYINNPLIYYRKESENSSTNTKLEDGFPYWEWYEYKYDPIRSLHILTNKILLSYLILSIKKRKISYFLFIIKKIRHYNICLRIIFSTLNHKKKC